MTIDVSNNNPRIEYSVAEGVTQTVFAIPFDYFEDSDVTVYVDGSAKVLGVDYTVTLAGNVEFVTATPPDEQQVTGASGGSIVVLVRHVPLERVSDFQTGQDINRAALNTQLDTIVAQIADLDDRVDRAIHSNDYEVAASLTLPSVTDRKGKVLGFNATTGDVEASVDSSSLPSASDVSNWNTAYGWGDHSLAGYYSSGDAAVFSSVQFSGGSGSQGTVSWNADEETLDLIQDGATLQLGQEVQWHCRNNTGSDIPDGTPVMATGTLGASGRITIAPMVSTTQSNAKYFLGITTEAIANDTDGKVTHFGKVRHVDTSAWNDGDVLYLDSSTDGALTNVAPTSGMKMAVAFVIHAASNGTLAVRTNNLDENTSGGTVTSVAATVPTGFSVSGSPITTSGTLAVTYSAGYQGYTSAEASKLAGIETGATADQTASEILTAIKTVDGSTSGLDADLLDGNHATAFATAAQGALADSALQSSDIGSTVQAYSAVLSGTTASFTTADEGKLDGIEAGADVTDAANVEPLIDAHLNYSTATSGQLLSFNGTDYDWVDVAGAGTVTSVAATVPTGFSISGSPITAAGTLAISYSAGYQGYTSTEASKLAGIEAGADVTDTANVTAAGALMDSEVTNLAAVKAFDPTDYEPADATILKDADIGVNVQAYSSILAGTTASFTTANQTKLNGIEAGADVTDTANVTAAGALMDSEVTNLAAVKAFNPADYATAAQGALANSATQPGDNISTLTNDSGFTTNTGTVTSVAASAGTGISISGSPITTSGTLTITNTAPDQTVSIVGSGAITVSGTYPNFEVATPGYTDSDVNAHLNTSTASTGEILSWNGSDYDWIAAGGSGTVTSVAATVPTGFTVSGSPITSSGTLAISYSAGYQGYTTTEASKLSGIEAGADVTDTANVTAAGALMDSELTDLAGVKALDTSTLATLTGTQTLTNKTLTAPTITGTVIEDVYALSGTTPALEPANGSVQTWTLSGNSTPTDSLAAGEAITLMINDGTAYTITWPTMTWVNNAGSAPTLATSGYTVVALWKVSTTLYGALVGDGT